MPDAPINWHDLFVHQNHVREEERKRIAQEIHDDLGQRLLSFKMQLSLLSRAGNDDIKKREDIIKELHIAIDETISSVRTLINRLRPPVLDLGLVDALSWLAKDIKRVHHLDCEVTSDLTDESLSYDVTLDIFRVVQEALTNVVKHAKATKALVSLKQNKNKLRVAISDNGVGFPKIRNRLIKTYGITNMRERVAQMGATLKIDLNEKGATVSFEIVL